MSPPAPPAFPPVPGSPKHYPPWGNALLSAPDWKSAGATGLWGGQVRSASSQGFGSRKVILLVLIIFARTKPWSCAQKTQLGFRLLVLSL